MANERVSDPSRLFSESPIFMNTDLADSGFVSMRRKFGPFSGAGSI
jgi:hypothetical protein